MQLTYVCKTKFRKFSFTLSIWRDGFLAAVSFFPTPMDRWRISVMGKPVLSLPINDPFRIPIRQAEGTHWCRARERNRFSVLCWDQVSSIRCRCRGVWIQSEAAQMEQGITNHSCLYSVVYLLLMNGKFSDPFNVYNGIRALF